MGNRFWLAGAMLALLAACGPQEPVQDPESDAADARPDHHTSQHSLDWAGTYEGLLPCAGCIGVLTTLRLESDGTYALSTRRLVRGEASATFQGRFTWSEDGGSIRLASDAAPAAFQVGEGRLLALNPDGSRAAADAGASLQLVPAVVMAPAQAMENHVWSLVSATTADNASIEALFPAGGQGFAMTFRDARLNVTGGCNGLRAGYELNGEGQLAVGNAASTMMACEPSLMAADSSLAALLASPLELALVQGSAPTLALMAASGEVLLLRGEQTPEARFGPANIAFFEVGPRRLPCEDAGSADGRCLQMREISFDAQGLRVGEPGDFVSFAGEIEGYEHAEGTRNVLRVRRFDAEGSPMGGVMVLDLVVESEAVPQ
jgi:heat shock protein HslJ/uncharacterized lipoprotein NlpE involved in copper resistance